MVDMADITKSADSYFETWCRRFWSL